MKSILQTCADIGATERQFAAGSVLLEEGAMSGLLYVLIEGVIEVARGETTIVVSSEPGSVFGEMSALLDAPHSATARTLTPTRAYVFEGSRDIIQSHPEIAFGVARILAQRLQAATTYLVDIKRQYQDHENHFAMVDEVLESLVHQQGLFSPGSDRQRSTTE
ncbi:Crp/Fnr family transcriptional regulator [Kaistia nematophila]|uniref:Crp/Fnr family transcriptional regulator n=1 Tax=Kaistia nematophila TaxID=2994654 RepID=A0A9X3E4F3_9HYPH|nr:Crp/Fnr family transcriptional regulator [Kaistia nematophila]MCX5571006.1 Crp/Fnr family transcriptional regulator [Kaistia nematophila]